MIQANRPLTSYTYWNDGSLKSDANEQISLILYDTFIKQPREVQLTDGRKIKHYYDGAGTLLKTIYYTATNTVLETWDFVGNMIYRNGQPYQMNTPEGRATYNAGVWTYEFDYKDNLGNTRVSFKANGQNLEKTAETAFDPWGVRMNVGLVNAFQNRFEFLNRQKESTFGINSYRLGARGYNGTTGRFDAVDPVIEGQEQYSNYHYSYNNPIRFSDADGLKGESCCEDDDPSQDPFLFAKIAVTAFYDTKHAFYNTALRVFGSDLRADYKVENGQQVFQTEFTKNEKDNSIKGKLKEAGNTILDIAMILPGGSLEGKLLTETSQTQTVRAVRPLVEVDIKTQANAVKANLNGNKNSVTIKTKNGQTRYDLDGKPHAGVDTPHSQSYKNNTVGGQVKSITRVSKVATPMTKQEVRTFKRYLQKQQ